MSIREERLMRWAQKKDLKRLHKALYMPDHEDRLKAVIYVGLVKDPSSLTHLRSMINDPSLDVLRHAAHAIAGIDPDYDILPAFKKAINRRTTKGEGEGPADDEYVNYKVLDMYSAKLDQRNKIDGELTVGFAVLITGGVAILLYLLYNWLKG